MKKILIFLLAVFITFCAEAQKDVTTFLGIPVDGTKTQMIQKLRAKGFKRSTVGKDVLEGEFNGSQVYLSVVTNGNKVWRIVVMDKSNIDEAAIRIRFNNLCRQFEKNPRYYDASDQRLSEDEDISYGISIENKQYEASYNQKPLLWDDPKAVIEIIKPQLLQRFTEDELENPSDEVKTVILRSCFDYLMAIAEKKSVWFKIGESYGKYFITIYYDNGYNMADGEDL